MASDTRARLAAFVSSSTPDPGALTADVVAAARAERMHLLLSARLRSIGAAGDSPLAVALAAEERRAAADELARTRELVKVLAALDAEDCRPIVFKGTALAHTHYARPWLRPRLDADVLVPEARRPRAAQVFERLGYERPAFVSGRLVMYQEMYVRSEPGGLEHVVDLHWRVANRQVVAGVVSHADLIARGVTVTMEGVTVRVPGAADALVVACVHRAAHHYDRPDLLWLYDIHLLASRLSDEEWRAVVAVARAGGVTALCRRGLGLAAGCFGTAVPAAVLQAPHDGEGTEPSAVFLHGDRGPAARLRNDLEALGWGSRIRLMREVLFPPPSYMRAAFGAGEPLFLLYARRVVLGAVRWMRDPARQIR